MEDILQDELSNVLTRDAIAAAANDLNLKLLIALTVDLASEFFIDKKVSCQIIVRDRRSDEKDQYHALVIDTCTIVAVSDDLFPDWRTGELEQHRRSIEIAVSM